MGAPQGFQSSASAILPLTSRPLPHFGRQVQAPGPNRPQARGGNTDFSDLCVLLRAAPYSDQRQAHLIPSARVVQSIHAEFRMLRGLSDSDALGRQDLAHSLGETVRPHVVIGSGVSRTRAPVTARFGQTASMFNGARAVFDLVIRIAFS